MRSCNSRIPEEYLVCYQMSQHNWVIIKMLYRYLRRCLLSWHRSRLGFVTPSIGQVTYQWTKGITYVVITVRPIKIFVEYVGANMGIQVPLLVIDRRGVSVMST